MEDQDHPLRSAGCRPLTPGMSRQRPRQPFQPTGLLGCDAATLYCARFSGHGAALCRVLEVRVEPFGTGLAWGAVSVFLDEPLGVVSGGEGADGFSDVVDGLEDAAAITARTSSIRSSRLAMPPMRSDKPVPRLSNRISREHPASREKKFAHSGLS